MSNIKEEMILSITPAGDKELEGIKEEYYAKYAKYIRECYKTVLLAELNRVDGKADYVDKLKSEHKFEYEGTCKELREAGKLTNDEVENEVICDREFYRVFKNYVMKLFAEVERDKYKKRVLDICGADIIARYKAICENIGQIASEDGVEQ